MEQETTTYDDVTTRSTGIRYGLIGAVVSIVFFLVIGMADVNPQGGVKYVAWIITVALLLLAHKYYKDNRDGFMNYGEGIAIAFWMGLVTGVIYSIFTYIYIKFVDQGYIDALKEMQAEAYAESGMSEEQIEKAMSFGEKMFTPGWLFVISLIGTILTNVIIALIVTIFTKKTNPEPTFN